MKESNMNNKVEKFSDNNKMRRKLRMTYKTKSDNFKKNINKCNPN
jgi:hypothetical protein